MLDAETYELAERLARTSQTHFTYSSVHNLSAFLTNGFPTRVSSMNELHQMVDAFHAGQLERLLVEMGALSESDLGLLIDVIDRTIELQLQLFPERRPIIPYASAVAILCVYRKMRAFNPGFETVLEIGPGGGLLSYFLSRHDTLNHYCQIEACQSLYLLQSAIGRHAFGLRFVEHAFPALDTCSDFFGGINRPPWQELGEQPETIALPDVTTTCEHFPWWQTGAVAKYENHFDIVTSNANLNEFSEPALHLYLKLARIVLKNNGLFLVQGSGADFFGRTPHLPEIFAQHRFAVVASALPGAIVGKSTGTGQSRALVDDNILLVKEGHFAFEKYFGRALGTDGYFGQEDFVHRIFFEGASGTFLPAPELKRLISERIAASVTSRSAN